MLSRTNFQQPSIPVVANIDAKPHTNVEMIRSSLEKQLTLPVLWEQTIQYLIADGMREFVEVGVGSVLSDLTRRIAQNVCERPGFPLLIFSSLSQSNVKVEINSI
jgi:acyl transferase domain-containing protein